MYDKLKCLEILKHFKDFSEDQYRWKVLFAAYGDAQTILTPNGELQAQRLQELLATLPSNETTNDTLEQVEGVLAHSDGWGICHLCGTEGFILNDRYKKTTENFKPQCVLGCDNAVSN
jgi:hypothetical protein